MSENNKRGRPKRYVFWDDWQAWLLKEWYPFKANDFAHLQADVSWIKKLLLGLIFVILTGAIAVLVIALN